MAGNRDAGVDPRFDPVFQRGYDPAVHGDRRSHPGARHATEPSPIVRAVSEPSVETRSATPATGAMPVPEPAPDPATASDALDAGVEPEARGRNPFRLALLLASIAAVGGAVLLLWRRSQDDPWGGPMASPDDIFAAQLVDSLIPPLLTAGFIGFCAWLVLAAVLPKARRDD